MSNLDKLEQLKPYITKDQPFGPIDAERIDDDTLALLFEKQNRVYKAFRSRPSIVMGRRGSGKTAYLRSVYFQKQYQYYAEIMTAAVVEHISSVIQDISTDINVERVSELWEKTLWTCVLIEIRKDHPLPVSENLGFIDEYLGRMGILKGDSLKTAIWKLESLYRKVMEANPKNGFSEVLGQFNEKNFESAKLAANEILDSSGKRCVILMDSIESFQISIVSVGSAIQGLLKLAGSMNNPKDVVDIRLCFPTELSRAVYNLSSNPLKDFSNKVLLEWTATDLVLIGAQRLMYFLGIYYPDFIKGKKSPSNELNRSEAMDIFKIVLPDKIVNQNGFQEDSISYILRHTQLLPRHFLTLLNSIFRSTYATQRLNLFPTTEEKIIRGVREVEESIVQEIFRAFYATHPAAQEACRRCLPHLDHVFTLGKLQSVFTKHGKAIFNGGEFFDFQKMLVEIGAIGRVIPGLVTDLYVKGEFQYTAGHELSINYNDDLCLHPLFSGIYGNSDGKEKRPVYPAGNGLDD